MQNSLAIISLELGVAVLFWLVFVVLETAVFQFLQWDTFKGCIRASLIANLASGIIVAMEIIIGEINKEGVIATEMRF